MVLPALVLAVLGAWALLSVGTALLAGGAIRLREARDARCARVRPAAARF